MAAPTNTVTSLVSIGQPEADRLGIDYRSGTIGITQTANGAVPVRMVTLSSTARRVLATEEVSFCRLRAPE